MSRNVPKLRFKGFEDEWRKGKLGDMSKIIMGQSPSSNAYNYNKEGLPLVQGNADITKRITTPRMYTTEITKTCEIEDIIMSVRAPVGSIAIAKQRSCIGRGVCSIKAIGINQKYLYQVLLGYEKKWLKISQGSTFESINSNDIKGVMLNIPSLQEQEKIANFLSKVDSIIEKQEKKVQYWNSYKKGMMQKIFSQKIRFKDENGRDYPEWQKKKLGNVCLMFSGGTPASKNKIYYDGDIPFIRSAEINSFTTELKISELGLKNSSAKIVDKGDLLYALYGATSGEVGIARMKGAINQAILCIRSKEIINCYLLNLLQYNKEKIIETYIQGGQGNLSASILKELNFDFPCLEEQTKIANFLSNIDNIIEKESKKLEELKQWKKGLLQQLFV
ncbi:restriction endonuclease subunit S [Clostridium perfringens]|uniref:restriction endonuclease subunit S n=1 Tax=Clostridium perfringens TaxID=1502 RepID=UPI0018E4CF24|nr:restriction endonuclease subunit S [Clostridium perfringens]MBI6030056.1 restriction endonuclease subunit S [Clostridium perfringens]MBI6033442.1 restriction endonuclease subunit S [Clostridium perfringens]